MPIPRKTQKQIAERSAGNLLYSRLFHPLRRLRMPLAVLLMLAGALVAIWYLQYGRTSPRLEWWNTSGPISRSHAAFAQDCQQCHDPALPVKRLELSATANSIDLRCERCHVAHTFHQPNVVVEHSCVACHHEHLGSGPMPPVTDVNCLSCHGNASIMAASANKGAQLLPAAFVVVPKGNLVYFQPPRPAQGYTQVVHSFESDHPAFQIQREHLSDPDTLKFNHQIHLTGDIPMVDGHKLDCAYCHQPDSRGAYMQPLSFEKSCRACHALQIDPTLPDFQLPHPKSSADAEGVRDFILTLPTQYTLYAEQHKQELHLTDPAQIAAFVGKHMEVIRQRTREGDDLIKDAFYADNKYVHLNGAGSPAPQERALFPGCAYCHEVKTSATNEPVVTAPVIPDRWFIHASFDHAQHTTAVDPSLTCAKCHDVFQSEKTSDISLPDQAWCITCHSTKGGVVSTCITCHGFHNTEPAVRGSMTELPNSPN